MAVRDDLSLVLDRRSEMAGAPGFHAILIGISDYANLEENSVAPDANLAKFRRIDSSALTAVRVMQKLIALDEQGRLSVPLKTIRLLTAPSPSEMSAEPNLVSLGGSAATRDEIESALREWRDDVAIHAGEQAWFFFSGHAIRRSVGESILLASDSITPDFRLGPCIRLSNVRSGMAPSERFPDIGRTQFYFVDAGQNWFDSLEQVGNEPTPAVFDSEAGALDDRKAPIFFSAPGPDDDIAPRTNVTMFAGALLWGLENASFAESELPDRGRVWPVTAMSLTHAIHNSADWRGRLSLDVIDMQSDSLICFGREPPRPFVEPERTPSERLNTQRDNPATVDALGRKWFARILATRIVEAHAPSHDDSPAFMVHLHGPWGSGKSSVLNFVRKELKSGELGDPWLVVDFNAWKHQRLRPPWWSLIRGIYAAALSDPNVKDNMHLRRVWWRWRLRADWLPILLVAFVLGGGAFAITRLGGGNTVLPSIAAAITAAAGVYGYARFLLFGSSKAAQTYLDIRDDPFGPVIKLLNDLVAAIGRPVIVFIDDLDRCDSDYVVELLEGIQTLQRSAPITYLVAADRKWICSSIEKKYTDFAATIGDAGRPLGYLFLDKMFQISVGIPRMSAAIQAQYWAKLLAPADEDSEDPEAVDKARRQAAQDVRGLTSQEDLQRVVDESANQSAAVQQAVREQAALQITSAEATRATEHRLQKLAALLEPNPRAMKRLVNAVALAQASAFLEGRSANLDLLARWAMVELRWPILADLLATNPQLIGPFQQVHRQPPDADDSRLFPSHVAELCRDRDLLSIIGPEDGETGLDCEALKNWLA